MSSLIEKLEAGKSAAGNSTSLIRNGAIDFCINIVREHTAATDTVEQMDKGMDGK